MNNVDTLEKKVDAGFAHLSEMIDSLAISVKNGFDQMVTRDEFDKRMTRVDLRFDQMDRHFDRIENISIVGHERRIDNLEDDIRLLKTKVGLK